MQLRNDESLPVALGAPIRMRILTDSLPENERFALLQHGIARTGYRVTLGSRRDDSALSARVDVCAAGGLSLASMTTNLIDVARTRSDVAADTQDWFVVYRVKDAPQHYSFRNLELNLRPGDVGIGARNEVFRATSRTGFAFDQLLAPVSAVRHLLRGPADGVRILSAADPMAKVIGSAMSTALNNCADLPGALAEGVLGHVLALASLAAGASEEGRDAGRGALRAQQLEAAKRQIERRLADPDLSPATVAAALRISPRTVHALFAPTGESFTRYVLRRRLAHCHAALTRPDASGLAIANLAFACGFNSLATFNRAFLLHFGHSPSDARAAAQSGGRRGWPAALCTE